MTRTASTLQKIDTSTYRVCGNLYVEKMGDGSWTAYEPVDADDRYLWAWHSPKHSTRRSAVSSARFRLRRQRAAA